MGLKDSVAKNFFSRPKILACILNHVLHEGKQVIQPEQITDRCGEHLKILQNADGSFSAFGGDGGLVPTSESISQVLVALSALGIDADKDPRFIKNGNSVLDALLSYYVEGGGFRHIMEYGRDGMATEQAYYALTAYYRMLDGDPEAISSYQGEYMIQYSWAEMTAARLQFQYLE